MNMYDILEKKKNNLELSKEEIEFVVNNYTNGNIPEYQISALLMAICINGMSNNEIFNLIRTGNIAYELVRPQKLYYIWFAKVTAQRIAGCLLRFMPVLILALILPYPYNLTIPSIENFILFLI